MHTLVQYLFESSMCLVLLYAFYYFVLRKETFFQLNRLYLLSSPIIALSIPLLNIDLSFSSASQQYPLIYPIVSNAQDVQEEFWNQMMEPTPAFQLTLADLLFFIYLLGALIMATRLSIGLFRLYKLIRKSHRSREDSFTLVETDNTIPAASFFSYVFWNQRSLSDEKRIILEHELVHVRQKHSIDVLLMEFCVILKWFNPLIYWFRNSLRETHEYIADHYMSKHIGSAYQYATFLATHSHLSESCHPLANNFAAIIRKRLKMLARGESSRWKFVKYMLALPILGTLLMLFSFNLVDRLPTHMTQPFRSAEQFIEDLSEQTIFTIDPNESEEASRLFWGNEQLPISTLNEYNEISIDITHVSPALLQQQLDATLVLIGEQYKVPFTKLIAEVRINEYEGQRYHFSPQKAHLFSEHLLKYGKNFTVYLRFETEQEAYYSVINVSDQLNYIDFPGFFMEYLNASDGLTICVTPATEVRQASLQTLPPGSYLKLDDYHIPVASIQVDEDLEVPVSRLPASVLQRIMESKPSVHHEGKELEVNRIALSLITNGETNNCDFEPNYKITCVKDLIATAGTDGKSLTILLRTQRQEAFIGQIVWQAEEETPQKYDFMTPYIKEKWPIFTQKQSTVIPPNIPRPAFHETSLLVNWGKVQIPIPKKAASNIYQGAITISESTFKEILFEDIAVFYHDQPLSVLGFNPNSAHTADREDFFSFYRWAVQQNGVYEVNYNPVLQNRHTDIIIQKLEEGFEGFYFQARLPDETNPTETISFQVKVKSDNDALDRSYAGIYINPGVNAFQLINRPNQPTIIKIDTTDQRYRWMYDMYKEKPEVQVYHIPAYQTINRVITLDDALLPPNTLEQRKSLVRKPLNIDNLPEYFDFKDKSIQLKWGSMYGVDDQTVYPIKTFKKESNQPMELQVGTEQLQLQQFDILFVPDQGDAKRFTTNQVDHPDIQQIIRKMGPKTSVLITKIIAQDEAGRDLHFPLTFAFHLN